MAVTERLSLLDLDAATYTSHPLHDQDRDWPETNCYVDLWIEVLHALGLDPYASLAFTLSDDFDGEQWEFFKQPPEDLRRLYGLEVHEVNIWRTLEEHIEHHLRGGHLLTVEVDSWFLPDTAGVSYQIGHQKSSIVPQAIDRAGQWMGYFHNRGYYEVSGADYVGALRVDESPRTLPPYAELIRLRDVVHRSPVELRQVAAELATDHLRRRPPTNPVERLGAKVISDIEWLRREDPEVFHGYAFGTLRQCGAWASTAASFAEWLDPAQLEPAITAFNSLSATAKTCQFKLARAVNGRSTDLAELFTAMADDWAVGYAALATAYG